MKGAALWGFVFLGATALMALGAYLIAPDGVRYAQRPIPELAFQPPGTRVFLLESYEQAPSDAFSRFFFGAEPPLKTRALAFAPQTSKDTLCFVETNGEKFCLPNHNLRAFTFCYWLGTDLTGRDVLSRLIIGTRVTLAVGLLGVLMALGVGASVGITAGWFGGWIDAFLQWWVTVVWSVPTVLLAIVTAFALGKGFFSLCVAVGLSTWVEIARQTRALTRELKTSGFAQAGRAMGFSGFRIAVRHVVPNLAAPLGITLCGVFTTAILLEAGLSFLGLGVAPPVPSWGGLLYEGYAYLLFENGQWLAIFPGILIVLLIISVNLIALSFGRR